ncbi:hypothetical protein VNO78_33734 [Psophocarpus tetragonolobus]|uniref:Uncharacterized protein n=1 Tax=Psophocarpus tetragonolobus TaxID=3891 RepID=A0AAN9P4H5_PSOTE
MLCLLYVYPIGPFPSFLNQSPQNHLESLGSNLWKEDIECLSWLETKEPKSVVYVNFESITVMSPEKLLQYVCNDWGIGIEINTNVKERRWRNRSMKEKAEKDTKPGGSSYTNLDKVINEVFLKQN